MSPERVLVERTERIMATEVSIHVAAESGSEQQAGERIEACAAWLREVETCLTRFVADSELCQLNAASGSWRPVSQMLFQVVELSVAAAEASGGLFDPTILPALEALGYDRDFKRIAFGTVEREQSTGALPVPPAPIGTWAEIELDRARRRIRLPRGTRLDLGGIAKGWAADVAVERFFADVPGALVNIGGDVRARGGLRDGEPWAIGIGDPRDAGRDAAVLTLGSGGLATSGATARWWRWDGARQHHLIDPRTGRSARLWINAEDDAEDATLIATATALAPTAAHAEVAAKVALLRGYPDALGAVEAAWGAGTVGAVGNTAAAGDLDPSGYGDADVALLLVLGTGDVVCSANFDAYLKTLGGGGELWLE